MKKILITGASGFIGRATMEALVSCGDYSVSATARKKNAVSSQVVNWCETGEIGSETNWFKALAGVDCVIHTAAQAHKNNEDSLEAYRRVNVEGTINLARQASGLGVSRFVFISSIGVNGFSSVVPFNECDIPKPVEAYAISKFEAEQTLLTLTKESAMDVVILRPPLVYGPKAPGNFRTLVRWVRMGVPLPLGMINNKRSMVGLGNLIDLIMTCIEHPAAANQIFVVGDGEDLSISDLLRKLYKEFGKSTKLVPIPLNSLIFLARLVGKKEFVNRFCGTLQVDISKARRVLGWNPPFSVDEELHSIARDVLMKEELVR